MILSYACAQNAFSKDNERDSLSLYLKRFFSLVCGHPEICLKESENKVMSSTKHVGLLSFGKE